MAFDALTADLYFQSMVRLIGPYLLYVAVVFAALGFVPQFDRLSRPVELAVRFALAALIGMVLMVLTWRFLPF